MTQTAINYARVLYELGVDVKDVSETKNIFTKSAELREVLNSPIISETEKQQVIVKVFPESMHRFLKVLNHYHNMSEMNGIMESYDQIQRERDGITRAVLYCAEKPDDSQLEMVKASIFKRFGTSKAEIAIEVQPELMGGFVLRVGDIEMDWSLKGRLDRLQEKLIRR